MEGHRQLDTSGITRAVIPLLFGIALLNAQPESLYERGISLARAGQWADARNTLLDGVQRYPSDKRFPVELAAVAFKQKQYSEAVHWLRRAQRFDTADPYTADFLATIYFLQGNYEAAVQYWNRVGKPRIDNVRTEPALRIDAVLLDRAFTFAPASTLTAPELHSSRARLAHLGVFDSHTFRLDARPEGTFDLVLSARERNGWGAGKGQAMLSALRGIAWQSVHLDYLNVAGSSTNITSMLRWDTRKRRIMSSLSGPLDGNPGRRYVLSVDVRDEEWDTGRLFTLRRSGVSGEIASVAGRWSFRTGGEFSHRRVSSDPLSTGFQLKHMATAEWNMLRVPERRLNSSLHFSAETGKLWAVTAQTFERLQIGMNTRWLPQMTGDDYAVTQQIRAGRIVGRAPFDELFILGLERDNDLWMRAHTGTCGGRKGSAPMSPGYVLVNSETDKNVYTNGMVGVKLSPFLDIGRTGSAKWLWDTGVQMKLRVSGIGLMFVYGKDLRSGNNTFYLTAVR